MEFQSTQLFGRNGVKVFVNRPTTINQFFLDTVEKYGSNDAVITEHESFTYAQLDEISNRIASNLQNGYGVEKGDRVAVLIGNGSEFPLSVLACSKIGAIMVPVNVKLSPDEIHYILGHSKPKILIYENEFKEKINAIEQMDSTVLPSKKFVFEIKGDNTFSKLIELIETPYLSNVHEEDSAYILYTSGTTGRPKGAVLSHINVIHSVMNYATVFETDESIKTAIAVPMFHVTGLVGQLLHMFYIGGTVYSIRRYQNEEYIHRVLENQINFLFNVPTIFIMMFTSKEFQIGSFDFVKKVAFGGSPIYQQTFQLLQKAFPNASLHNAYGSTETTSPATLMPVSYPNTKVTSVGKAVKVADIKVMNPLGEECQPGESGELFIKGPMVIKEYWDNPSANLSSFSDGFWKSGDIGIVDDEGYFYIRDRMKDMINRAGEKIFSIEVEDVLKNHPLVIEAAVIGEPDPIFGEKVKAFIVGPNLTEEHFWDIKQHCLKHLAKFKVPEELEILDTLPRNASGKILKNNLKNLGGVTNA
ncbi:Acyl-CoA synthetase (AMP-forming)/AMP-acid ligase II [Psychrobacillus sp. OK028]|uniref:class I adenylate-forming enzyme family protein n=1 Tax=Psychrobacillus sp. OK028 TaxID=1884359 RepID=UPI0008900029|nr:class I adenylate-forming enzyme family protein [Psychrobacillus sp. OK028]SDM39948.1 Acyl-CoA synthetase (AMP-forming)/AMP-acid ligase II [Psychrobacillus sp. OK028]